MVKTKVEDVQITKGQNAGLVEPTGCVKIPTHAQLQKELLQKNEKYDYNQDYLKHAENFAK